MGHCWAPPGPRLSLAHWSFNARRKLLFLSVWKRKLNLSGEGVRGPAASRLMHPYVLVQLISEPDPAGSARAARIAKPPRSVLPVPQKARLLLLACLTDSFAFFITFIPSCLISPFPSSPSDECKMTKREICCRCCYFCPAGSSVGLHGKAEFPPSLKPWTFPTRLLLHLSSFARY